jgi:hypothetical protein
LRNLIRSRGGLAAILVAVAALCPASATAQPSSKAEQIIARFGRPGGQQDPVLAALAAGTISTDVPGISPGEVAPPSVPNGYVLEGGDLGRFDVTNTPEGQAEIAAFVKDLVARGEVRAAGRAYVAYSLPDVQVPEVDVPSSPNDVLGAAPVDTGPIDSLSEGEGPLSSSLVVPSCVTPALVGAVLDGTGVQITTLFSTNPVPREVVNGDVNAQAPGCDVETVESPVTPYLGALDDMAGEPGDNDQWTDAGGLGCLRRKSNNTAWYDPCSWWYHRTNDKNPKRDTYGLKQYGTGKSKSTWNLFILETRSWPVDGSPWQEWVDWGPRADSDYGSCANDTAGVQVAGAYLEHTTTHCEQWDIDKGGQGGEFANDWKGKKRRAERDTAMTIATSTSNGYVPNDYVRFDYYAF